MLFFCIAAAYEASDPAILFSLWTMFEDPG
jgi:hypothetical protein